MKLHLQEFAEVKNLRKKCFFALFLPNIFASTNYLNHFLPTKNSRRMRWRLSKLASKFIIRKELLFPNKQRNSSKSDTN